MIVDRLVDLIEKTEETNNHPFMLRYNTPNLTIADHYRFLKQLYLIQKTLEKKVLAFQVVVGLPQELRFLLHRSELIRKDLLFLKPFVSESDNKILPATEAYVAELEKCENVLDIWGHFLGRVFADLHNCDTIKPKIYELYSRSDLSVKDGADFFGFELNTSYRLKNWIEKQVTLTASMEKLKVRYLDSFERYNDIISELEEARVGADIKYSQVADSSSESTSKHPLDKKPQHAHQTQFCCTLFSKRIAAAIAITAVTVVGLGMLSQ